MVAPKQSTTLLDVDRTNGVAGNRRKLLYPQCSQTFSFW